MQPTNLQELADSLAAEATTRQQEVNGIGGPYEAGYIEALLATRATVLAMIAQDHPVFADLPQARAALGSSLHKAAPDTEADGWGVSTCVVCKKQIKSVPGGKGSTWVHDETGMVVG